MKFDVIVIGGGHAGIEAAYASARKGCRSALVTLKKDRIGFMSCNPAIGGLAKGQLVKEIDALGGAMGVMTDRSGIQFRRLNASKGPAVRSSRAQCDKLLYAQNMQTFMGEQENVEIIESEVAGLLTESSAAQARVTGVLLKNGEKMAAKAVIITSGTFLRAIMHRGEEKEKGGRHGDQAAYSLSDSLHALGFQLFRLKTGTPPRLHRKSIKFDGLIPQPGDEKPVPFSFYTKTSPFPYLPQMNCYITYTNQQTHEIIAENFHRSPMFTGDITGVGPRYCPSIEDKVKRFNDKERHQIFLEPEGLDVDDVYINGVSTSLPTDVQDKFIRSINGLESAEFIRYGYAVEYDAINPQSLKATLESKDVAGLFFAGQINGTSGYEEAGAQGIVAGINAALLACEEDPLILSRLDGYIGVMIDDLITKGVDEPYRMFTSRAEYRLILREDNADLRLGELARKAGVLHDEAYSVLTKKKDQIEKFQKAIKEHFFNPGAEINQWLEQRGFPALKDRVSAEVFLRRPEVDWSVLCDFGFDGVEASDEVREQIEIQVKYDGYIRRDMDLLEGIRKNEGMKIGSHIDFESIPGLSNEIKTRMKDVRPETIGQFSRLKGVTPAAVANLMIFIKTKGKTCSNQKSL